MHNGKLNIFVCQCLSMFYFIQFFVRTKFSHLQLSVIMSIDTFDSALIYFVS